MTPQSTAAGDDASDLDSLLPVLDEHLARLNERDRAAIVSMWLKSQGVTKRGRRPVRGNIDWKQYEATADVPEEAQVIYPGITLNGGGKIWIDDVKMEVVP